MPLGYKCDDCGYRNTHDYFYDGGMCPCGSLRYDSETGDLIGDHTRTAVAFSPTAMLIDVHEESAPVISERRALERKGSLRPRNRRRRVTEASDSGSFHIQWDSSALIRMHDEITAAQTETSGFFTTSAPTSTPAPTDMPFHFYYYDPTEGTCQSIVSMRYKRELTNLVRGARIPPACFAPDNVFRGFITDSQNRLILVRGNRLSATDRRNVYFGYSFIHDRRIGSTTALQEFDAFPAPSGLSAWVSNAELPESPVMEEAESPNDF